MKTLLTVADRLQAVLDTGKQFAELLNDAYANLVCGRQVRYELQLLKDLMEALPTPWREEGLLAAHGCDALLEMREYRAARSQLNWYLRRLATQRAQWPCPESPDASRPARRQPTRR